MESNESIEMTEPAVVAPNADFPAVESEEEVPEALKNTVSDLGIMLECGLQEGFDKEKWLAALMSGLALSSLVNDPARAEGCNYADVEDKPAIQCSIDIDHLKNSPILADQSELIDFISNHATAFGEKEKDFVVIKDGDEWKCKMEVGGPEMEFKIDPKMYASLDDLYNNNLYKNEEAGKAIEEEGEDIPSEPMEDLDNTFEEDFSEDEMIENVVAEFTKCVTESLEEKEPSLEKLNTLFKEAVLK